MWWIDDLKRNVGRMLWLLICFSRQWALAQMALPPPIRMGQRVRSWSQNPLDACGTHQWKKDVKYSISLVDSNIGRIRFKLEIKRIEKRIRFNSNS